jgi:hypothetical protein
MSTDGAGGVAGYISGRQEASKLEAELTLALPDDPHSEGVQYRGVGARLYE